MLIPSTVPIFMLIVRLLLLTAGTLDALSARSWLSGGVKPNPFIDGGIEPQAATLQLGMMPFALDDAMLPGEKRTISLSDKMLIQLIKEAPHDCIGQLLLNSNDDVAPISPLLQVEKMDFMGTSKATLSATVRCMGRVRLLNLQQDDGAPLKAEVELYCDGEEDEEIEEAETAAALDAALSGGGADAQAAGQGQAQKDAVTAAARAIAASAAASDVSPAEVVAAARELLQNLGTELRSSHASIAAMRARLRPTGGPEWLQDEWLARLDDVVASRRAALCSDSTGVESATQNSHDPANVPADDSAAADDTGTLCAFVGGLWGIRSEAAGARQLLSFASAATMGTDIRSHALFTQSTSERLSAALCALRAGERRLAAELALRQADSSAS